MTRGGRWIGRAAIGGGAVLAALAVALRFPVYFRADDALYLRWAATHADPLDAFIPSGAAILGVFRPLQNLAWWALYRGFGLEPLAYQCGVTLLLLASLALLAALARRLFTPAAGWWSIAAFVALFPYLLSVAFWFSDLSFLLETVLMLASLLLLPRALATGYGFASAVAAYVLAVLAKEPAAFIVPAAAAALLLADWPALAAPARRRGAAVVGGMCGAAVAVALVHPSLAARQGPLLAGGLVPLAGFVAQRWQAYAAALLGGAGVGLVALALVAAWGALRRGPAARELGLAAAGALALAVTLRRSPSLALALLLACLAVLVVRRRREGAGALAFAVPFLGLLTVAFVVRTYLFEAAFGLALVAGSALAELAGAALAEARRRRALAAALAVGIAVIGAALAPQAAASLRARLAALQAVSDARMDFRDAVHTLVRQAAPGQRVAVVAYEDMGLDYARDILPLPDHAKAHRQKTMMGHEVAAFLAVAGRGDLAVTDLSALARLPAGSEALVLVMNGAEDAFLAQAPLARRVVFRSARGGDAAALYRVTTPGP